MIRAFIAIELPREVAARVEQVSQELKQRLPDAPVRWTPVEKFHLTLKFLGDVSAANLELIQKIIRSSTLGYHPFEISVNGLGAFPKKSHPRVIWIGLEVPSELLSLQHLIDQETSRIGYKSEERGFTPHLTLARVSRNALPAEVHQIGRALDATQVGFLGRALVDEIHLFRSDLKPGGAVYTSLYAAPLLNPINQT